MELRKRIIEIRERAGLLPSEFARAIGVSHAFVSFIEKGEKGGKPVVVSDHVFSTICRKFGCSFQWLKYGEDCQIHSTARERLIDLIWMLPDKRIEELIEQIEEHSKLQLSSVAKLRVV